MGMITFVETVKRKLRDEYGFKPNPTKTVGEPPNEDICFDANVVPDGDYPMTIHGMRWNVRLQDGFFKFEEK